jgi:hypothetical protein
MPSPPTSKARGHPDHPPTHNPGRKEDNTIATFPLHIRHIAEYAMSEKIQTKLRAQLYTDTPTTTARAAGDPWALRGIPVVGVKGGVGGAIPGTKPESTAA